MNSEAMLTRQSTFSLRDDEKERYSVFLFLINQRTMVPKGLVHFISSSRRGLWLKTTSQPIPIFTNHLVHHLLLIIDSSLPPTINICPTTNRDSQPTSSAYLINLKYLLNQSTLSPKLRIYRGYSPNEQNPYSKKRQKENLTVKLKLKKYASKFVETKMNSNPIKILSIETPKHA